jgi:hypothetical protein
VAITTGAFHGADQHVAQFRSRRPTPSAPSCLTAVGIVACRRHRGAGACVSSVVNAVLFRAFPYYEPGRLVFVWENNVKRGVGL